jgi:hypothetical protein
MSGADVTLMLMLNGIELRRFLANKTVGLRAMERNVGPSARINHRKSRDDPPLPSRSLKTPRKLPIIF